MKLEKENTRYEINFEEYQKIYKEESTWSMSTGTNVLSFSGKKEYNAGKGYLTKVLFFAYKDKLSQIQANEGIVEAKKALDELVDAYYAEYEEYRSFFTTKVKSSKGK